VVATVGLQQPLVVGVDGSDDGLRAVTFAGQEAMRLGCGVRLVHVYHESVPMTPMMAMLPAETLREAGQRLMTKAARVLEETTGGKVPMEASLGHGQVTRLLLEASGDGRALVVGRRHIGRLERLFTGSVTTAVAARSGCPVIAVPADWQPDRSHARVVVGVDGSNAAMAAVHVALEAASQRGASVLLLHAWDLPYPNEDVPRVAQAFESWLQSFREALSEALVAWRLQYPDVPVELDIRREHPVQALSEASRDADLLVIARHGTGALWGMPVGSTARAMVSAAHCPLVVVPHPMPARAAEVAAFGVEHPS